LIGRLFLFILLLPVFLISAHFLFGGRMVMLSNPFAMVVAIVFIAVFGGVLRELVRQRKDFSSSSQKELAEIRQHIAQIEADIADIKEQIADFIIRTN